MSFKLQKLRYQATCGLLILGLSAFSMARADEQEAAPEKPAPKKPMAEPKNDATKPVNRDPTEVSKKISKFFPNGSNPQTPTNNAVAEKEPVFELKARLLMRGRPPLAIVSVDKKLFMVRVGYELRLARKNGTERVYKISSIDNEKVIVEEKDSKRRLILN